MGVWQCAKHGKKWVSGNVPNVALEMLKERWLVLESFFATDEAREDF